jgi:phosphatidylserine/phosphatidylglycerophosphate/cardiolipin synthase-like enzyme
LALKINKNFITRYKNFFITIFLLLVLQALNLAAQNVISPAFASPSLQYAFSPRQGATTLVIDTINQAKETILVAAYSFTSQSIAKALVRAKNRGIDVKIVMDKSQDLEPYSSLSFFLDENIPVRINYNYVIMHNKFMVIDNKTLQLGSYNYTYSAEKKNAENVMVIKNAGTAATEYAKQWQKLWDEAE